MSLFDVITHSDIDIDSDEYLEQLPKEVVKKWRSRVVEHACQSAESIAHQDKSGKCQELIDATRAFMRNEISIDELNAAHYAAYAVYYAARYAADYAAYAAYCAANAVYYAARYAATAATAANAANEANLVAATIAIKMYKDWLIEELLAHDSEEMISVV